MLTTLLKKGWCPSLEKPMETGDGLLVRLPIKFGKINSDIARKIAALSIKYGNSHLDLSMRGNLQLRGVSEKTYKPLHNELSRLGFNGDFPLHIIANPLDKKAQDIAEELEVKSAELGITLPEKFLIVIDGGGVFSISALPCDMYIPLPSPPPFGERELSSIVESIIFSLQNITKCNKKASGTDKIPMGFVPLSKEQGIIIVAAEFGRIEAENLRELAEIAENYSQGEIIFAPFRRIILPNITNKNAHSVLNLLEDTGFITTSSDSRLNIHACVGAPACSSAFGETRNLARKWANDFPNLNQTVHITGCDKGCAYKGKADITITATEDGYKIDI